MTKVSELTGVELDYWVARSIGWVEKHRVDSSVVTYQNQSHGVTRLEEKTDWGLQWWTGKGWKQRHGFNPSSMWFDAGPLIQDFAIGFHPLSDAEWEAEEHITCRTGRGPTPLIAAMRALVASVYGDFVPAKDYP